MDKVENSVILSVKIKFHSITILCIWLNAKHFFWLSGVSGEFLKFCAFEIFWFRSVGPGTNMNYFSLSAIVIHVSYLPE
jgi:hypothetical protein